MFKYDVDDNRISKTTNGVKTDSVWANGEIVNDVVHENGFDVVKTYNADNTIFSTTVLNSADSNVSENLVSYNVVNTQGDLVQSVSYKNDGYASSDLKSFRYNAYGIKMFEKTTNIGNDAPVTAVDTSNPFGYRGYYTDIETGLYYLMARYYDPTTGQFTQEDTYQEDNLEYNLYGYCSANPVMYTDPSGHWSGWASTKNPNKGSHQELTQNAIDRVVKKGLFSGKGKNIIRWNIATDKGFSSKNIDNPYPQFHTGKHAAENLKKLFNLAVSLSKSKKKNKDLKAAVKDAKGSIYNLIPSGNRGHFLEALDKGVDLKKDNIFAEKCSRQYQILGIALHLAQDIFAHKVDMRYKKGNGKYSSWTTSSHTATRKAGQKGYNDNAEMFKFRYDFAQKITYRLMYLFCNNRKIKNISLESNSNTHTKTYNYNNKNVTYQAKGITCKINGANIWKDVKL